MSGPSTALLVSADADVLRNATFLRGARTRSPELVEPRRRLVRCLLATADTRAVVLSAPAGYGKTALLEAWSRSESRRVVWVTLDRLRDDVAAGEPELAHALAELRGEPRPAVLVIDDADASGGVVAARALQAAARDLPASVTLVLSGRSAPPAAIGHLRSAWPMLELGAEDLAMTHGEASEMLRAAGVALDGAAVATLLARTEGWPAGLRLAAVAPIGSTRGWHGSATGRSRGGRCWR